MKVHYFTQKQYLYESLLLKDGLTNELRFVADYLIKSDSLVLIKIGSPLAYCSACLRKVVAARTSLWHVPTLFIVDK